MNKTAYGFTLIELMISLIIAAILMTVGLPMFSDFMQQIRLSIAANDLRHALALTRSEAIKRNGKADLVAIENDWKNGWVIKTPDNTFVMTHEPLHKDIKISAIFTDQQQHIAYNESGHSQTDTNNKAPQSGHIQLSSGPHSRIISVNFLGQVKLCNPASNKACSTTAPE